MNIISIEKFEQAINFGNKIIGVIIDNNSKLFIFLSRFKELYEKEVKKLPYHINLIDELRANENAHSRILVKLLKQKDPITKKYEVLESFLLFVVERFSDKEDFKNIRINKPDITQEVKRIDLWIKESDRYAIIIENKVNYARDQEKQLERYIDITKEVGFKDEQIFVIYLPPTYEKEPDEYTWGKYYESEIREKRYLSLSFRDDILQWLIHVLLPNILLKDKYLSSAIEQYIDHLEGKFNLRTINNKMNMELQEFIKKELGLNGIEHEQALKIIQNKKDDMQNALNQLNELENEFKKKIIIEHFHKLEAQLKADFPNKSIISNLNEEKKIINVGIEADYKNKKVALLIEYRYESGNIFYGIRPKSSIEKKDNSLDFSEIINDLDLIGNDDYWYYWQYTCLQDDYNKLKILIERIINY